MMLACGGPPGWTPLHLHISGAPRYSKGRIVAFLA